MKPKFDLLTCQATQRLLSDRCPTLDNYVFEEYTKQGCPIYFFSDLCRIRGVGKIWLAAFCERYNLRSIFAKWEKESLPQGRWVFSPREKSFEDVKREKLTQKLKELACYAQKYSFSQVEKDLIAIANRINK
jgi:hypothetical protein